MPDHHQPQPFIPQADPGAAYRAYAPAIDAVIARVLRSGRYVQGEEVAAFEAEFAAWHGASAATCASGTDALQLALLALGIGPGMAVATVAHTAVATIAAIELTGAIPVLLDIEPVMATMDAEELARVLNCPPPGVPPIRAVVPVHLYGQPADMDAIVPLCARHGVALVEDCSQAHGAQIGGRLVGTLGSAGTFSFYPTKNLAALGDAGAVIATDPAVTDRVARLRQYGWDRDRISQEPGQNSRMDELQAAVLRVRLPGLHAGNARRRTIAAAYDAALAGTGLAPPRRPGTVAVFHQYVIRTPARAAVRDHLLNRGIATAIHYAPAAHRHPAYAGRLPLGPLGCRRTDAAAAEILSLPIHPELDDAQVEAVCTALHQL